MVLGLGCILEKVLFIATQSFCHLASLFKIYKACGEGNRNAPYGFYFGVTLEFEALLHSVLRVKAGDSHREV